MSWFYQTDDCWNSVNGFIRKWMIKQPNNNFYPVFVKLIKEIEPIIGSKETLKIILSFPFKNKELAEKDNRSLSNYVITLLMKHLDENGIDWRKEKGSKK